MLRSPARARAYGVRSDPFSTFQSWSLARVYFFRFCPDRTRSSSLRWRLHVAAVRHGTRSEEHTSELQSPCNLVCRLLLEKKNLLTCTLPNGGTFERSSYDRRTTFYSLPRWPIVLNIVYPAVRLLVRPPFGLHLYLDKHIG